MIDIEFDINEDVLSRIIISTGKMPASIANELWQKNSKDYLRLQDNVFANIKSDILTDLQKTQYFKEMFERSVQNLKRVEKLWENNKGKVNEFLKKIMKVDGRMAVQTCYVVAPGLCIGLNVDEHKIFWGHKEGLWDENYDLVYLVHEALHSAFDTDNFSHTIIEEIADIELAKSLNNSKVGYECHAYTQDSHVILFPYFNLYLDRSIEEIKEEQKQRNIFYNIEVFEKYRKEVNSLNIFDFTEKMYKILISPKYAKIQLLPGL